MIALAETDKRIFDDIAGLNMRPLRQIMILGDEQSQWLMPDQIRFGLGRCASCIEKAKLDGAFAHLFRQGTRRTGVEIQFDSDFGHVLLELGDRKSTRLNSVPN